MTLLLVLLMSIPFLGSVQSIPTTIRGYEKEITAELETKGATDPIPVNTKHHENTLRPWGPVVVVQHTEEPQTNSKGESSILEFVFKSPNNDSIVQKGSTKEKYRIVNLPTKNEDEKLNLLDSSKHNEIDIDVKDELDKVNITGMSKSEDLLSEAQIKRDHWLFDPQEMSSITGGLPNSFYDAFRPIQPFPELSETVKTINPSPELSETAKTIHRFPEISETAKPKETLPELGEKSFERSSYESLGGPPLFPIPKLLRDIDDSFYVL